MRQILKNHVNDIVGVVVILVAILVACGIYGDLGGVLGSWVDTALGASIGAMRFFLPPALLILGVAILRTPEEKEGNRAVSLVLGSVLLVVGTTGMAHLAGGQPEWGGTYESFAKAGGAVGGAFGWLLERAMGSFVAGCLLIALALIGFSVVTGRSLWSWFKLICRGVAWLWTKTVQALEGEEEEEFIYEEFVASTQNPDAEPLAISQCISQGVSHGVSQGIAQDSTQFPNRFPNRSPYDYAERELTDNFQSGFQNTRTSDQKSKSESHAEPSEIYANDDFAVGDDAVAPASPNSASPNSDSNTKSDTSNTNAKALTSKVSATLGARSATKTSRTSKDFWKLPPLKLLNRAESVDLDEVKAQERGRLLEQSLVAHGVQTRLVGMVIGPTVTRYELELGEGVKVSRLTSLHKDIAYAMASPDVRILAPIPGRRAIGIEVPNVGRQVVMLGDILTSTEAGKAKHPMEVAVGRDITGRAIMMNLGKMPHLLIAGSTGSGKSSCVNSMITSILMRSTPEEVRMILVDPKMVEMRQFEHVPHLLTEPVVDPKRAANALNWAVKEMERRYKLLSTAGYRDMAGYNNAFDKGELDAFDRGELAQLETDTDKASAQQFTVAQQFQRLPYILVVVDELADLMMVAARDVEDAICRIAQKARAVGIHLIIATQRPSTNVITGVIKANIPARLAFSVSSLTDSRVILDQGGAERLVGQGDMLLLGPSSSAPRRVQGAWVSEEEVQKVVATWKRQVAASHLVSSNPVGSNPAATPASILDEDILSTSSDRPGGAAGNEEDELLEEAMEIVVSSGLGSTSMLQRKLRIGFARAGRLMDLLEERGVVGPSEGSKAREVYMTKAELTETRH